MVERSRAFGLNRDARDQRIRTSASPWAVPTIGWRRLTEGFPRLETSEYDAGFRLLFATPRRAWVLHPNRLMQRVRWLGVLVAALLGSACDGGSAPHSAQLPPGPQASAPELAAYLAPRIGGRVLSKLDVRAERVLVGLGVPREPRADSEQRRVFELALWNATSDALEFVRLNVRAAALADDAVFAVTSDAALVRIDRDGHETRLIDRAQGKPALLAGGSVAVTRSGAEPGETDVWLCEPNGHAHAIAAAPGPDDLPMALTDGRLAFVSGRSGVASIWIAHPLTGSAEQLTNRGLVAGEPFDGFVPPPVELLAIEAQELRYDAGDRELWRVDLATGVGSKIGGSAR